MRRLGLPLPHQGIQMLQRGMPPDLLHRFLLTTGKGPAFRPLATARTSSGTDVERAATKSTRPPRRPVTACPAGPRPFRGWAVDGPAARQTDLVPCWRTAMVALASGATGAGRARQAPSDADLAAGSWS